MNLVVDIAARLEIANQAPSPHEIDTSLQLIDQLTVSDELLVTLNNLKCEHERLGAQLRTFDLTDPREFKTRILMLEELCNSLKQFCLKKGDILSRLQRPLTTNILVVEYCHQDDFINLIGSVVSSLATLSQSLHTIQWTADQNLDKSQIESILYVIPNVLAKYRQYVDDVMNIQTLVQKNKLAHESM